MNNKAVIDFKKLGKRYIFTNPIKILKTREHNQVQSILEQVETYQKKGYYVVGYLSYEAAKAFEKHFQVHHAPLLAEYLIYFAVHDSVKTATIPLTYEEVTIPQNWTCSTSKSEYQKNIETIHQRIRQGDTYQVNYTIQLETELSPEESFAIYNRLVVEQQADYNAYITHDDVAILSISPELFFEKKDWRLTTRPMKGTTSRGTTLEQDVQQAKWLAQDSKNRAENMMIVDLLRNDMNRISEIGSETVKRLCQVEQYSTVWQMTSTIESTIRKDVNLVEIFKALFPCGSITGAPKISTMAIIHQIEKAARGVYCGTVGLCLPNGQSIFNVAIRTIQMHKEKAIYGVGGGITWDSNWEDEYIETQQKSKILQQRTPQFDLITTGKISQGKLIFQKEHVRRLKDASRYFSYPFDEDTLQVKLDQVIQQLDDQDDYRLRLMLAKNGQVQIKTSPLQPLSDDFRRAQLVQQTKDLSHPFVSFKTNYRPHLTTGTREKIYYNEHEQLLETSIGNLLVEIKGKLYTPPVELGVLNGIYRQHLIQTKQVHEKIITLNDLQHADGIYACNAVRGIYSLQVTH
ncbi:MAG: aminodeoxychorismate synthase component I [Streptococcus sp.]|nr:aminodeoxychorismate synthase component I [Streptococcus sp.]